MGEVLPCMMRARAHDRAAERGADRLVAEADAEDRIGARLKRSHERHRDARLGRRAGPGETRSRPARAVGRTSSSPMLASFRRTVTSGAEARPGYWTRCR
jgi:hypothetical protein